MALVRKILETTLTAGSTSVTFTDTDIPNSLLRVYSSQANLFPLSQTLSGNVLNVNYKAQSSNVGIALEIVKQGLDIVDNVTSSDTDKALSAKQGKVLKNLIDAIVIPTVPENITDLDDVIFTDPINGQSLVYQNGYIINSDISGANISVNHANWIATSTSAAGTKLATQLSLNKGKYLYVAHSPYSTNTQTMLYGISVNNILLNTTLTFSQVSYGCVTGYFELSETSDVAFVSGTTSSYSWDSLYLDRGGADFIKIG